MYNSEPADFLGVIHSFCSSSSGEIIVMDNSRAPLLGGSSSNKIKYFFNNKNLGFGPGHNLAFKNRSVLSKYHLIINPDIKMDRSTLKVLVNYLEENEDVGIVMPKVLYPSGEIQHLCKLLPTPVDLFVRRFIPLSFLKDYINSKYILSDIPQNLAVQVPLLSGCFLLIRSEIFESIGGFDERFPLYMEDFDLVRRVGEISKVIYYPLAKVTHGYQRGSYKRFKLLVLHIYSACKYFNKWGWFKDEYRGKLNSATLTNLKYR